MKKQSVTTTTCALICACLFIISSTSLEGQSISRQVIGIAGGTSTFNKTKISWTAGESIIGFTKTADNSKMLSVGFHQPNLSVLPQTVDPVFSINISPNPTQDLINVTLVDASRTDLQMSLSNVNGQVLVPNLGLNPWKNEIDLTRFPAGTYYLRVSDDEEQFQTYKVIKTK